MTLPFEGARLPLIPMTPDSQVIWSCDSLGSMGGKLYVAPHCTADMVEAVLFYASTTCQISLPELGKGDYGQVYSDRDAAIKVLDIDMYRPELGLSDLRANVGTASSLKDAEPLVVASLGRIYDYRSPEYFCSFLPNDKNTPHKPVWLMSFEPGRMSYENELPSEAIREEYFTEVVKARGFGPNDILFDDQESNTLIHDDFTKPHVRKYVKIDVMAAEVYDF